MFENRVSRRIFGVKRDEVTGEWRRLPTIYSVLSAQHHSDGQIEKNETGRACGTYGRQERCVLVGRPKRRRPLGRRRSKWRIILKWIFKK